MTKMNALGRTGLDCSSLRSILHSGWPPGHPQWLLLGTLEPQQHGKLGPSAHPGSGASQMVGAGISLGQRICLTETARHLRGHPNHTIISQSVVPT